MARINVEDDIETKKEFWKLLPFAQGNRDTAMGMLVRFFRIAQKAYGEGRRMTRAELETEDLACMIECGWAVPADDGFRCKGEDDHFAWYRQKVEAGKKGGRPKKPIPEADSENRPVSAANRPLPPVNPPAPVPAPVPAQKQKTKNAGAIAPADSGDPPGRKSRYSETTRHKMRAFFDAYAQSYRAKYGGPPEGIRDKAVVGRIGNWIEHVAEDRARELAQVYLQIDYRPINEAQHDLWGFIRHLNRIGNALNTGQPVSGIDWAKVFGEKIA